MVSVSVILPTARNDYSLIGLPDRHIFEGTFNSLLHQTFQDFEVIVVDGLYPERKKWLDRDWQFPVKYVPVHANHRFWLDHKRWNVCGALNTGILHAEGELLVRIDDCSEFEPEFLRKFWNGYQKGYFPLAMHTRYRGGKQAYYNKQYKTEGYDFRREEPDRQKILSKVYSEGDPIRDTRWAIVEKRGGRMIGPDQWFYGYSSFSLESALKVNGFNELFDGDKSQEDQEMGLRLYMAGYENTFLLDVNHWVIEHEHEPISIIDTRISIKCNYAIYLLNKKKKRWRANSTKLTEEDIQFIIEESLKPPCSPRPNFYEDDCRGELFNLWVRHQPIFDLREERLTV